jgi:hypothetical protein
VLGRFSSLLDAVSTKRTGHGSYTLTSCGSPSSVRASSMPTRISPRGKVHLCASNSGCPFMDPLAHAYQIDADLGPK